MAHVLITGASGFIGPHLAEALLSQGDRVTCLVRKTSNVERLRGLNLEFVFGDVTDAACLPAAIADVGVVYHLAGLTKSLRKADLWRVNHEGMRNMAQACAARTNPPVLVVVSSLAAVGPAPADRPCIEGDPLAPVSNYGRSKRDGELAAAAFAGQVPITILRPPIVFGEGDRDLLQMVRPIAHFGLHLVPGFRIRRFSLLHAADLAAALVLAAERGSRLSAKSGAATDPGQGWYFVAGDENPTYAELGQLIATALGRPRFRALRSPELLTWTLAAATQAVSQVRRRPGILSLDKAREAVAGSWTCSASRAEQELGFRPAQPLDERLRQTINWYRLQGWL